jgi:hypothetical protein
MSIDPRTLLSLEAYAAVRATVRTRMIGYRRARSVGLGPSMRLCFEDETTLRYQIQEVLRAERLHSGPDRAEQAALYSRWLPSAERWTATLMIELPAPLPEPARLHALSRAVHRIYLACRPGARVFALANGDLPDRHLGRPSGVHFLAFELDDGLRRGAAARRHIELGCDDDEYAFRRQLPALLRDALALDALPHGQPRHAATEPDP